MRKRILLAAPALAVAAACTAPGTTTFGAPLPHAANRWPVVIVQDDAPWFPVGQAIADWHVPVVWGRCNAFVSCIHVTEQGWLPNNLAGNTDSIYGNGVPSRITIQLAEGPLPTYADRLETACHELGHAFGLGHDQTGGCMRPGVDGWHAYPSGPELQELRLLYGT